MTRNFEFLTSKACIYYAVRLKWMKDLSRRKVYFHHPYFPLSLRSLRSSLVSYSLSMSLTDD